ncbi:MAG: hypothetical protein K6F09_01425 [Clostridiales bacterium]|nr:hypothetical protein [Clostridiales bacterium]
MKKSLLKIFALALSVLMVLSFAACGGDKDDTTDVTEPAADTTSADVMTEETGNDETSAPADVTEPEETTAEATTETTTAEETTQAAQKAPSGKAEIIKFYNDATAKAVEKKAAFSKTRETGSETYDAGLALKAFKNIVYKFMGIGSENKYTKDVVKGDESYEKYFKASTLSESDVTSATCDVSGKNYVITLSVKDGSSSVIDGQSVSLNAPLDKSGISSGTEDKDYYDHKTAQCVYDAINEIAGNATIKEAYSSAVVKATVDSETGEIKDITVTFDIDFEMSQIYGSGGTASGTTTVKFTNFNY